LNLLEASIKSKVKRFVYVSSCAVYGDAAKLPINEDAPVRPLSPYASSKLAAEEHCTGFFENHGIETVRLRYFNVYGPRQAASEYAGVMVKFLERIRTNQPPVIFGDGEQTRDFVYVRDVVEATLLALNRDGLAGNVFNIGTGQAIRIVDLYRRMAAICGVSQPPRFESPRAGDILRSRSSPALARRLLGFQTQVGLEEGLGRTLAWYGVPPSRSRQ
jgi:UDP-glucose 4-epimerase